MSMMAVIVICLVFAMMLGPLMLMRPSPYQQKLAVLRNKAASAGLRVQLQSFKGQSLAVYQKPWPSDGSRAWRSHEWMLELKGYAHDIHFLGCWDWLGEPSPAEQSATCIQRAVQSLPSGVVYLSATKLGVSVYWNEAGGEAALQTIERLLSQLSSDLWVASSR